MYTNSRIYSMAKTLNAAVVVALTYFTGQRSLVTAQSFTNCQLDNSDPDITICEWSASPLVLTDITGTGTFTLGSSTLVTSCNTGGSFTTFNCDCHIYISDGTGFFDADNYCNSCTLLSLTEFSFSIHWDCSNRLTGNCPILDSNGCQTGDDPTPFPVESPTDFPTDPPEDDPTPFPVESPTDFPTDPPEFDPTPFPVESPTDFPTDPPEFVEDDDDDDNNPTSSSSQPPASTPQERAPTTRNDNSSVRSPNSAPTLSTSESEQSRSTTSGGSSHQYYFAVGVSSFMYTVVSLVLRV